MRMRSVAPSLFLLLIHGFSNLLPVELKKEDSELAEHILDGLRNRPETGADIGSVIVFYELEGGLFYFVDWHTAHETVENASRRYVAARNIDQTLCGPENPECVIDSISYNFVKVRNSKWPGAAKSIDAAAILRVENLHSGFESFSSSSSSSSSAAAATVSSAEASTLFVPLTLAPAGVSFVHILGMLGEQSNAVHPCAANADQVSQNICETLFDEFGFGPGGGNFDHVHWPTQRRHCEQELGVVVARLLQELRFVRYTINDPIVKTFDESYGAKRNYHNRTLSLRVPWYVQGDRFGIKSCVDDVAAHICADMLGQHSSNGLCSPCSTHLAAVISNTAMHRVKSDFDDRDGWMLEEEYKIRRIFHGIIAPSQCVFPRPDLYLSRSDLDAARGFPRALWSVMEPLATDEQGELESAARGVTVSRHNQRKIFTS